MIERKLRIKLTRKDLPIHLRKESLRCRYRITASPQRNNDNNSRKVEFIGEDVEKVDVNAIAGKERAVRGLLDPEVGRVLHHHRPQQPPAHVPVLLRRQAG